ncbi:accessory Sec system glycosylation chaperone GtfB [Leuconostoc palmae]|uniref:accessory Sec system glycosylation chaperone GtfB n=1 Tax=Leuconostoc palmae TaxID=501487 RepID=UPI001C7D62B9|nr:accessory Sec system glycosylation chaperone GtfB [Leuconostoc palmae]
MINLFEYIDEKASDLLWSLNDSNIKNKSVVVFDNGWLNENIISPFSFYSSAYSNTNGKPLFFNDVPVPRFWGIRGNDQLAEIYNDDAIMGKIFYHEGRVVERVEWWHNSGETKFIDYYNKFGHLFAKTYFHGNKPTQKSYFSPSNKEIIIHNLQTDQILLNTDRSPQLFSSVTDFVCFFIKNNLEIKDYERIIYNSLSIPLFVINQLGKDVKAALIWDEPMPQGIPGNMMNILTNYDSNTRRIFFQRQSDIRELQKNTHIRRKNIVSYLGKLYAYHSVLPKKTVKDSAVIVTNSDSIWHLQELVEALPNIQFKIMALTEMSQKLMHFEMYHNVNLVPAATVNDILNSVNKSDYLLDINDGTEVLNVLKQGFLSHTLIFAAKSVAHNLNYVSENNIFSDNHYQMMIDKISQTADNSLAFDEALAKQENLFGIQGNQELYYKHLQNF